MTDEHYPDLADGMRAGMRRVAQSVTVVSLVDGDGQRQAMTASSVTSVSAEPASMLVCVHRDASLHAPLSASQPFCINALTANMAAIANLCAGGESGEARFALGAWRSDAGTGLPFLEDALACFFCTPDAVMTYGTHLICVGKVDAVRVPAIPEATARPLLYRDATYGTFTA